MCEKKTYFNLIHQFRKMASGYQSSSFYQRNQTLSKRAESPKVDYSPTRLQVSNRHDNDVIKDEKQGQDLINFLKFL